MAQYAMDFRKLIQTLKHHEYKRLLLLSENLMILKSKFKKRLGFVNEQVKT